MRMGHTEDAEPVRRLETDGSWQGFLFRPTFFIAADHSLLVREKSSSSEPHCVCPAAPTFAPSQGAVHTVRQ